MVGYSVRAIGGERSVIHKGGSEGHYNVGAEQTTEENYYFSYLRTKSLVLITFHLIS